MQPYGTSLHTSDSEFLQPHPVVSAEALLEICKDLISAVLLLDK
jgi:hypothetical protein